MFRPSAVPPHRNQLTLLPEQEQITFSNSTRSQQSVSLTPCRPLPYPPPPLPAACTVPLEVTFTAGGPQSLSLSAATEQAAATVCDATAAAQQAFAVDVTATPSAGATVDQLWASNPGCSLQSHVAGSNLYKFTCTGLAAGANALTFYGNTTGAGEG